MIPETGPEDFILANMAPAPAPGVPELRLYAPHPRTGLSLLLVDEDTPPPYWAYAWAGGCALARHILDRPETVCGLCVLDLGCGGGIVALAAAKAGAARVIAMDSDPFALAAARLNAAANGVAVETLQADLSGEAPAGIELIVAGDMFYEAGLAQAMLAWLDRAAGVPALIGDPFRKHLPLERLDLLAEYSAPDIGDAVAGVRSGVFAFRRN
jgi:predicted nicotinamide N-methyase